VKYARSAAVSRMNAGVRSLAREPSDRGTRGRVEVAMPASVGAGGHPGPSAGQG
jgi:hypothetical protein